MSELPPIQAAGFHQSVGFLMRDDAARHELTQGMLNRLGNEIARGYAAESVRIDALASAALMAQQVQSTSQAAAVSRIAAIVKTDSELQFKPADSFFQDEQWQCPDRQDRQHQPNSDTDTDTDTDVDNSADPMAAESCDEVAAAIFRGFDCLLDDVTSPEVCSSLLVAIFTASTKSDEPSPGRTVIALPLSGIWLHGRQALLLKLNQFSDPHCVWINIVDEFDERSGAQLVVEQFNALADLCLCTWRHQGASQSGISRYIRDLPADSAVTINLQT